MERLAQQPNEIVSLSRSQIQRSRGILCLCGRHRDAALRQNCDLLSLVEMVKATHDLTTDTQEAGQLLRPLIRTLRRKLEVHLGKVPCIKNVRGRGYLLMAELQNTRDMRIIDINMGAKIDIV